MPLESKIIIVMIFVFLAILSTGATSVNKAKIENIKLQIEIHKLERIQLNKELGVEI